MDGPPARLLATPISEQARALQDLSIEEHRHAERLAWIFRVLLYLGSVLLLIYLSYLYVRLRANARPLKGRSDFEHLIAGISAELIDAPPDRTGRGIRQGLEQLGRHAGVDLAWVLTLCRRPKPGPLRERIGRPAQGAVQERFSCFACGHFVL